jgi:protein ImuB
MRSWIAVCLPQLPLQALRPRWCEPLAIAITEAGQVIALTSLASRQGVRIGMREASAMTIAPDVVLMPRAPDREQEALDAVALALLQYTPELAPGDEATLLMEVSASLSAFGGRLKLCRRVRDSVHALGFTVRLGMAPTAQAAWLFAHYRHSQHCIRRVAQLHRMKHLLDRVPFPVLPAARAHADWLTELGCRTLADLRRLPRAGLRRRADAALMDSLDRAYGEAPELFEWIVAPETFSASFELPYRIEQAGQLLSAAQRLLLQMTGWLAARQQAVAVFHLTMMHERGRPGRTTHEPSVISITLAEPAWEAPHLLRLLKERLERFTLPLPAIGLSLATIQLAGLAPPSAQLFPEPGGTPEDYRRLLELLVARLGPDAVQRPCVREDHRPEIASQWQRAIDAPARTRVSAEGIVAERPFWLLEEPLALRLQGDHPFYGSPLRLLFGPERIETGWWDESLVMRDYFVAQGSEGACYWIYRERDAGSARWYLHGLFA